MTRQQFYDDRLAHDFLWMTLAAVVVIVAFAALWLILDRREK
jgi:hypothetical protein